MKSEIGVTDADIVELPVLFFDDPTFAGDASALTGGVVNVLVANGHPACATRSGRWSAASACSRPTPPTKLSPLGLTVHFIDDWHMYHLEEGEVHCGTNAMRHETIYPRWEFVP